MIYAGYFITHFICRRELKRSFSCLDNNYSYLNVNKYHDDMSSLVFVRDMWHDDNAIYLEILVDRKKALPEDINTIARMIVRFITVPLQKYPDRINKKINRYESSDLHMFFIESPKRERQLI